MGLFVSFFLKIPFHKFLKGNMLFEVFLKLKKKRIGHEQMSPTLLLFPISRGKKEPFPFQWPIFSPFTVHLWSVGSGPQAAGNPATYWLTHHSDLRQPGNSWPVLFILLIIKTLALRHVAIEIISPVGFILLSSLTSAFNLFPFIPIRKLFKPSVWLRH